MDLIALAGIRQANAPVVTAAVRWQKEAAEELKRLYDDWNERAYNEAPRVQLRSRYISTGTGAVLEGDLPARCTILQARQPSSHRSKDQDEEQEEAKSASFYQKEHGRYKHNSPDDEYWQKPWNTKTVFSAGGMEQSP